MNARRHSLLPIFLLLASPGLGLAMGSGPHPNIGIPIPPSNVALAPSPVGTGLLVSFALIVIMIGAIRAATKK